MGGQSAVRRPDMPRPDAVAVLVEQPDKGVASDGRTRAEADAAAVVAHIAYDSPLRRSRLPDKAGGCPFEFLRRDASLPSPRSLRLPLPLSCRLLK